MATHSSILVWRIPRMGEPGRLQSMGSQGVRHHWVTHRHTHTHTHTHTVSRMEKEMATHPSTLAWRIPWTTEPDGLQSMGSQRVRHNWATHTHTYTHTHTHTHTLSPCIFLNSFHTETWRIGVPQRILLPRCIFPSLRGAGAGPDSQASHWTPRPHAVSRNYLTIRLYLPLPTCLWHFHALLFPPPPVAN